MSERPAVTVVGSINMDLTVSTGQMPNQGETVIGEEFATFPGGKGANQAVAAARLGANVNMVGAIGDDVFGESLQNKLEQENIHTTAIHKLKDIATGTATIILSEGDNRIIVAPGANARLTPEIIRQHERMIQQSDIILLQLEVPLDTVQAVITIAQQYEVPVILNPAPYQSLPDALLSGVDYLTPNEMEAKAMLEDPNSHVTKEQLIVTNGEKGVLAYKDGVEQVIPGFPVDVLDTTGAGDTFNGALATQLASGMPLEEAVYYANAAAALSIMKLGAQSGMPSAEEVNTFIEERSDRT
ncbi:ribokinase [Pontibacillus marinus]|uniref:Ribokinase n=1 Tax=Pontibacillus marinus BH030004 = DSM 16465 TaxID=1385511 RepID=A0A0A5HXH4_9BACI|nr:ribokinase [Pontibacillus marinus]KGX88322.1 ribokinase [Pontibacillus marinus BH030004 = DSM 16465]